MRGRDADVGREVENDDCAGDEHERHAHGHQVRVESAEPGEERARPRVAWKPGEEDAGEHPSHNGGGVHGRGERRTRT